VKNEKEEKKKREETQETKVRNFLNSPTLVTPFGDFPGNFSETSSCD